ncbi:molecular chaperone DnaJ [Corynebacterium canis]|uniref:Chaperone protein DnaJ n=1 Tax=Corynebacterium canis TaxID=679663 RepID=A0A5C5URZ1_9CORY|nr:molecular chaperone DnaJ [Corynebacterium canis]TWT28529.1 molecular chaperone DnaJ [Corynebacterium canis]WJY75882.1 Chaperone protein DnaJ [Corynebacterium canis]
MARDYYGILGVDRSATETDIRKAYRRLARKYHPDVNGTEEAAEKFREVSLAYEVLTNPEKRRVVDMGGDPMEPSAGAAAGGFSPFEDLFGAFFGGGRSQGPRSRVQPGDDALLRTSITLEEAFAGVKKNITVDTAVLCDHCEGTGSESKARAHTCTNCRGTGEVHEVQRSFLGNVMTSRPCPACQGYGEIIDDPCTKCHGDGRVKARRDLVVNVPAGISDGMRIRMAGQGEVGHGGGPAGDLYVEVMTQPHAVFTREGDDLHLTVRLPMVDAALGTEFEVTGLDGQPLRFQVAPGTQPADRINLSGAGMPHLRAEGSGDMVAHMDVIIPRDLDSQSKEHLRKLRAHRKDQVRVQDAQQEEESLFTRLRNRFRR